MFENSEKSWTWQCVEVKISNTYDFALLQMLFVWKSYQHIECAIIAHFQVSLFWAICITWCVFVHASLHICREEKPTRFHWMVYCTYNMLNMSWALLCPSSGAHDYMCVITAYGVQCLVAGCQGSGAEQQAMCPGRGMLHNYIRATSPFLDA